MNTAQLQRAILWAFLATLIAVIGVTTVAWIRRPKTAPAPAAAVRRGTVPVLANEPDGSVYDLNLKIAEMQERLSESEALVVTQQKRLDEARREREALQRKLDLLAGDVRELHAAIQRLQPAPPPPASNTSEDTATPSPPGGTVPLPPPPSPAAPP